jgi:hypothetical protein
MQSKESSIHTEFAEILTNLIELDLKRGLFIGVLLELGLDLTIATVLANDNG